MNLKNDELFLKGLIGDRVVNSVSYNSMELDVSISGYWLGGYRSLPNNIWVWTDGSDSTFMPWAPGLYNL